MEIEKDLSLNISKLFWYRINVILENTRRIPFAVELPLTNINAIIKGVNANFGYKIFFHFTDKFFKLKLREGDKVEVEILLCSVNEKEANNWVESFVDYFKKGKAENYAIIGIPKLERRDYEILKSEFGEIEAKQEICLEFLSPLKFDATPGKHRAYISNVMFLQMIEKRLNILFNVNYSLSGLVSSFHLLCFNLHFDFIEHNSKSTTDKKNKIQRIDGSVGKLYIKGDISSIFPFLLLCNELHIGTKLTNSQGYFILHKTPQPLFDDALGNSNLLRTSFNKLYESNDSFAEAFHLNDYESDKEKFLSEISNQISKDIYQPSTSTAFEIVKHDGSSRILEQLTNADLLVQHLLFEIIKKPFDELLEPESIGFRKNISRENAASLISKAVQEGYGFIMESDVDDFFPSIPLEKLTNILNQYIPESDTLFKAILQKCLNTSYFLNDALHVRTKGLCQGSPLSPILANLYLDSFDEQIKKADVRMVRYVDDFVILTKTKEQAESMVEKSLTYLHEMGLGLKKKKTHIIAAAEGFDFLGMHFVNSEYRQQQEEEVRLLKKPLYITEPYLSLALSSDAIELRRYNKLFDRIPMHRIAELIIMEKATLSTMLIKRCMDLDIPVTTTLDSGYFITTIKPDNKNYFDISLKHGFKYSLLSDTEKTAIAKSIAAGKFENFIPLFKQRYSKGTSLIINKMKEGIEQIHQQENISQVLGMEGYLTKQLYNNLNELIDVDYFKIKKRERLNPDAINSLLNLGSYLLFTKLNSITRALGLNPYFGFLHSPGERYETLVCDLQELFRGRIMRLTIRIINLKMITEKDFITTERGIYLTPEAKRVFIQQLEKELNTKDPHSELTLKEHIFAQVLVVKRWATEPISLTFYKWQV